MKSLSPRERVMITALPAGLLFMGYFFFVSRPAADEMKELRRQVGVARERVPSSREQAEALSELKSLEAAVKEKREAARERIERREKVLAYWNDPDAKSRGGEFIGNLLASHGIVLVEEAVAGEEDRKAYATLLDALPSAELWRLRVAGNYDAMRRTVAAIGETDFPLVPAGIEMEPRVEGNRTIHLWNLWICR